MAVIEMGSTSVVTPRMGSEDPPQIPVDLITGFGDSWTALGFHRGYTLATVTYDSATMRSFFGSLIPSSAVVNMVLNNCPGGMSTSDDPQVGIIEEGRILNGVKGFTAKGGLIDALEARGYYAANLWEYALGGATISLDDITTGAWSEGMPTHPDILGGDYGCTLGNFPGAHARQEVSMWLAKQEWLQAPEHAGHPYRDWSFCDAVTYAPTGRPVVLATTIGNDILQLGKANRWIDEYTGEIDPDGVYDAYLDTLATGTTGKYNQMCEAIWEHLNEECEVIWISYTNMGLDDPKMGRNVSIPARPQADYQPSPANEQPNYAPADWETFSTAENYWDVWNYPTSVVEHLPHTWTPNDADELYELPNDSPYDFGVVCNFPGGPGGTTFPWQLNTSINGFFKTYAAWVGYNRQRDITYQFNQRWWAHWVADQAAWQRRRGEPSNYYVLYGYATYNWLLDNSSFVAYGMPPIQPFPNRRWSSIYTHMRDKLHADFVNSYVVATGGVMIDFDRLLTVITKDFTTKNMSRLWRDKLRPRMAATEAHFRAAGRKFTVLDVWDAVPGDASFDPTVPAMNLTDWIEGVHPSSFGNPKWCAAVVDKLFERSYTFRAQRPQLDIEHTETREIEPLSGYSLTTLEDGTVALRYKGYLIPEYDDTADGPQSARMMVDSGPIPLFDDNDQRTDELPAPDEGWAAFMKDRKAFQIYDQTTGWMDLARLAGTEPWTFQLEQNGVVVPTTVSSARYVRIGNLCIAWWIAQATGTGTAGFRVSHTLPFPPAGFTGVPVIGHGVYYHPPQRYVCGLEVPSGDTKVIYVNDASGGAALGQAPSFAVAVNDILRGFVMYPVA